MASRLGVEGLRQPSADQLEGAVLQEAGEQQVTGLQQRQVLQVVHLALRQQARCLQVEQRRCDDDEGALLGEVPPAGAVGRGRQLDVGNEVIGDLRQRDLRDVQLVLGDQLQQQVERAGEVAEVDVELCGLCSGERAHGSPSPRTRSESAPRASKSAMASAIAVRTIRPRSTAMRWWARSVSRAC